jgi:Outer membrane protein beta-barrel domain
MISAFCVALGLQRSIRQTRPPQEFGMQRLTKACLLVAAAAMVCAPARARADGYVTPWIGANAFSANDEGRRAFGVTTGYMAGGVFGFEADVGYAPDFFGSGIAFGDSSAVTVAGNAILGVPIGGTDGAGVRPFVTGGVGLRRTHIERGLLDSSTNTFEYGFGAGMMGFFTDHVGLRGDVRYTRAFEDANRGLGVDLAPGRLRYWRASAGVTFR